MDTNLISVIIPVYNAEKYIEYCLKSVLDQTYKNLEIILIDDGSTDSSFEIIKYYQKKDKRIKILKQTNKGAGAARNYGLAVAKGRYIGFVDSDDWIQLDMYEYLIKIMKKENADIVACDYITTNRRKSKRYNLLERLTIMDNNTLMKFFLRIHGEKSFYAVWNMLYKADILIDCKFPEKGITEDLIFNYRAYSNCKKYVLSNLPKYYYYYNMEGVTRKELQKRDLALLDNWNQIVTDIKKNMPEMEKYALLNRWRADFTILSKAFLYGYNKNEIDIYILGAIKMDLKKNKSILLRSRMLNWKRKILLILILRTNIKYLPIKRR